MLHRLGARALLIAIALSVVASGGSACKPVQTQTNFSIDAYLGRWYIQQQMEISYLPKERNYCVVAEYTKKLKRSLLGYDIDVHNRDQDVDGHVHDSTKDTQGFGLCARIADGPNGKLDVAPCFLPPLFSGPYWVLRHDAQNGWALVVGGQPSIPTTGDFCKTGTGTNGAGLWIFTRAAQRDEVIIEAARTVATANGIDVSVLNDVDQSNCTYSYYI